MTTSIELLKLEVYEKLREKIKGIDAKKEWKYFKKLICSEVDKKIIEREV